MAVIKQKHQRVGVFIDVQNLYHSAKNLYGSKVKFDNLVLDIIDGRELVRAIGYVIKTESGDENKFLGALIKMGIETREKDLQVFSNESKKGDWDVGITVDMISMAEKLDVITLVSGDGDFREALDYVRKFGCQVEVVAFGETCSAKLKEVADDFIDLSKNKGSYLI